MIYAKGLASNSKPFKLKAKGLDCKSAIQLRSKDLRPSHKPLAEDYGYFHDF